MSKVLAILGGLIKLSVIAVLLVGHFVMNAVGVLVYAITEG